MAFRQFWLAWLAVFFMGAALIFSFLPEPAYGQQVLTLRHNCFPASVVEEAIKGKHKEFQIWSGKNKQGTAFHMMQSQGGGWTFYARRGNTICIFATGEDGELDDKQGST